MAKTSKNSGAPKHPPTAFFVFMEEFRNSFKENFPKNKSVAAVGKAGGEKWKSLSNVDTSISSSSKRCYFECQAGGRKIGAAMALVKSDVGSNITRLENKYLTSPSEFNHLYSMVRLEVEAKIAKSSSNYTNGLLWLTRAMDFLVELFWDLLEHADWA